MMEFMTLDRELDKSKMVLGIIGEWGEVQGYFFDYLEKDNRIVLFIGFDGKDGNRFITPVEIESYFYEAFKPAHFGVRNYKVNDYDAAGENWEGQDYSDNKEGLLLVLNDMRGKAVIFDLSILKLDDSQADDLEPAVRDVAYDYINEVNSKVTLSFGLLQLLSENRVHSLENPDNIKSDSNSVLKIINADEMRQINIDQVPIIYGGISYFSGVLTTGK